MSFHKLAAGILLSTLMGCGAVGNGPCTLLPCNNALKIKLSGQSSSFSLKLKATGQAEKTINCPSDKAADAFCNSDSVQIQNYRPEEVEITYTSGDKTVTRTLKPVYTETTPNGPGCGTCRDGEVTLAL